MRTKERLKKLKKNLRLYYLFRVLCTMNFVMPVFMLFLIDKGLSTFQIMLTQAAYTVTELLLTVPSGAFADKMGRKLTLILSGVLFAACWFLYGMSGSFAEVLVVEMLFAVSSAAFHGTGEAFLYDTLAEAGKQARYKKVVGTAYAIQSVMMGVASVAGGVLAKKSLALPFFATAVPAAFSLVPLFFLDEPKRKLKPEEGYWKLMKEATVYTARHRTLRNIMYYWGVSMLAGFMAWMLFQPMLIGMGMRLEYLGVAMMFISVAHGVGNKLSDSFEKRTRKWDLLLVFAGFKSLLFVLIYLASGYYLLVWALVLDLASGLAQPILTEWINRHSLESNRATVLSLASMSACLTFSLFSPLLGLYVDAYSEQQAFLLLAVMLGAFALRQLVLCLLVRRRRGQNKQGR
jgi:MFS family permease